MTLIADASAVAAWLMPDESGHDLVALARQHGDFIAPTLLWIELRNILLVAERRQRLKVSGTEDALAALGRLSISLDAEPSSAAVFRLARSHGLSGYDALYLELALRRSGALATGDIALVRAARAEGVSVA